MPTLKGTEMTLYCVQCSLYLVYSSGNVSIFHSTWLDTFWTDTYVYVYTYTYICIHSIPVSVERDRDRETERERALFQTPAGSARHLAPGPQTPSRALSLHSRSATRKIPSSSSSCAVSVGHEKQYRISLTVTCSGRRQVNDISQNGNRAFRGPDAWKPKHFRQ